MIPKMLLGKSGLEVPVVAVGCMRMAGKTVEEARELIKAHEGNSLGREGAHHERGMVWNLQIGGI